VVVVVAVVVTVAVVVVMAVEVATINVTPRQTLRLTSVGGG
jgi:hypothetical protein